MRDGVKLRTIVLIPKGAKDAPILLARTPYNANERMARAKSPHLAAVVPQMMDTAMEAGYIVAYQDVRGKHGSEGDYVMNRPLRGPLNATGTDHATDTYDTIEWLVRNIPESNGRVATIGGSYEGFTVLMSTVHPHPALKAAVPFAPMVDGWMGDDWFHNGAFRAEGALEFTYNQQATRGSSEKWWSGAYDTYDAWLRGGSAGRSPPPAGSSKQDSGVNSRRTRPTTPGGRNRPWTACSHGAARRADADRRRAIRSGGHLRRAGALQGARAERPRRPLRASRARAVEPRAGPSRRPRHRHGAVRGRHRRLVPARSHAAVPRPLPEGRARSPTRHAYSPTRRAQTHGADTTTGRAPAPRAAHAKSRNLYLQANGSLGFERPAEAGALRRVRLRSREAGAVSPAPDD